MPWSTPGHFPRPPNDGWLTGILMSYNRFISIRSSMKTSQVLFLSLLLLLLPLCSSATLFRINNVTGTANGANGIYSDPRDAEDVAIDGDTLLFEGSVNDYNVTLQVDHRLVIMGPGYFQDENPNTNAQSARIGRIYLYRASGGDANSGAAGTIIQGLDLADLSSGRIDVAVNDVIIRKNRLEEVYVYWSSSIPNQVHNLIISQNYFVKNGTQSHIDISSSSSVFQDVLVSNNIFEGVVSIPDNSKVDFVHNLFADPLVTIQNLEGVIRNNVFLSNNPSYAISADSITHNISLGSGLPSGNGNISNGNSQNLFLMVPATNGSDGQYQLKTTSAAQGAGYDGSDIGPYGGILSYVTYGYGEIPIILSFEVKTVINPGELLPVSVKATSGN